MHALWSTFLLAIASSALVIDDSVGQGIDYQPSPAAWTIRPDCADCDPFASIDRKSAFNGTWTGIVYEHPQEDSVASLIFNGTSVDVFCILYNSDDFVSDILVSLDGDSEVFRPNSTSTDNNFSYNVSVFSRPTLPPGPHTLTIRNHGGDIGKKSVLILDKIVITTQSTTKSAASTSKASSKNKLGIILGSLFGGLGLVLICIIGVLLYRREPVKPVPVLPYTTENVRQLREKDIPIWRRMPFLHKKEKDETPNFDPSLFVGGTPAPQSPPPVRPIQNRFTIDDDSTNPDSTSVMPPSHRAASAGHDPLFAIQSWRREQADDDTASHRLPPGEDMSETLSSYYDESGESAPRRPRAPVPTPTARRFTIRNT